VADEREREARARGDVVHGALAPLTGALAGGTLALETSWATVTRELPALLREGLGGAASAAALLSVAFGLVVRAGLPVLGGAFGGALVFGLLQTRGYFGAGRAEEGEAARPILPLALVGWMALAVLGLDALRALFLLHAGARPESIARAAATIGSQLARGSLALLGLLALIDHLLRARARRQRLGLDEPSLARRNTYAAPVADERMDALAQGASLVLFDEERAVALGRRGEALVTVARARGLAAIALREAARRRGLPLRAAAALELFDALVLGEALSSSVRATFHLDVGARPEASA